MLGFSSLSLGRAVASTSLAAGIRDIFPNASTFQNQIRTSTKRGGGSSKNNRKTAGKRLGVKRFENTFVVPGEVIVRQRGLKFHPGQNVGVARDHTLFAREPGYLKFYQHPTRYPHQDRSVFIDEMNGQTPSAGKSSKDFAMVQFPRGMDRYIGIARFRHETLPRDQRDQGRDRRFWGVPKNTEWHVSEDSKDHGSSETDKA
ncbi:ribosomal L27 protein-domain-containing protein [Naematelia encephala]|uniref:Large ribosomal subunit protein bL27m n=1 Tax=Naematelia encephala TaxID=71784 RepID=A0A1Y2B968_9TREE|nr:ribosomal L27 protein-domain-containing protein [Naematelia encephala]